PSPRLILVTAATGKVGQAFMRRLLGDPAHAGDRIRALCHNRELPAADRVEVVRGSIAERAVVERAAAGVTHVLHLATCKETPDDIMDVTVKGLFWLLEACRLSSTFKQFLLIGGDAGIGHFFYERPDPGTEAIRHSAYPGCYALSKGLDEVMLEQYYIQYDLAGCCLRAPWIMEKDDFKYTQSFGGDVFGGPRWGDLVGKECAADYMKTGAVPLMLDADGKPMRRNFVHVEDLVEAIVIALDHPGARQQTFNICMDEPVDYGAAAEHLKRTRGLSSVEIPTPYRSTWLDNSKAKFRLGWRPRYDLARLIDASYDCKRAPDDPRKVWYPG